MAHETRRYFLGSLAAATQVLQGSEQHIDSDSQQKAQNREYARIFAANSATDADLLMLRRLQENRVASPASLEAASNFVNRNLTLRMINRGQAPDLAMLLIWNGFALDATSVDHTTGTAESPLATFGQQFGPGRSSRALAIVHLAMYEAVNTISRKFQSYQGIRSELITNLGLRAEEVSPFTASMPRAITEAAFATLVSLYPKQRSIFEMERAKVLAITVASDSAHLLGEKIGQEAARMVLAKRADDNSSLPDLAAADFASTAPLAWSQDPVSLAKPALGGNWSRVSPFVVSSSDKYRPGAPPDRGSPAWLASVNAVKTLGGDPCAPAEMPRWPTPTTRSGTDCSQAIHIAANLDDTNETFKGLFWAYDGVPMLCAPPRLYNMVATSIALKEKPIHKVEDMARFLALINLAMSDAGVCAWESKYHYAYARPVTAFRALAASGSSTEMQDLKWTPLGAPVTNGTAGSRNLTPPFPAYPSGHATFGGALFETLRLFWGLGNEGVAFHFVSDEFNGINRGPGDLVPRPRVERRFASFADAEFENAQSRVWLGIHWPFDADAGIALGRQVARDVFANCLTPVG